MIDAAALGLFGPLEPGSASPFVHVKMKKDGTPAKVGDWEEAGVLAALCTAARSAAARQARAIRLGAFAVAPYRLVSNRMTPCAFCAFGDVCRVDDIPFPWRRIAGGKREDLLAGLVARVG
jgi:ATP-dependent helicase/DNAse subunit B